MANEFSRFEHVRQLELEAEWLVAAQLDLLAQVEAQVRTVRQTMRQIERLRGARDRVGPVLNDRQRGEALQLLAQDVAAVSDELTTQGECCRDMLEHIELMQRRLMALAESTKLES